jgi:timeless
MQNQEQPESEQDVIDWICENLTEKSRNRRGVIKKLKELGLIFKAPTKKSAAAAANRNLFLKEEDDKLRELYDEHRMNERCLNKIMEVFDKKRSKKAIAKRMVQLGLIADESEIMPKKNGRKERQDSSSSSSEEDYFDRPREAYQRNLETSRYELNDREISSFRVELEESLKEAIEWIIESLNEAAEDFEEPSDELSDAIPLVPVQQSQKLALEIPQFQGKSS